jgi:hypothetical protein
MLRRRRHEITTEAVPPHAQAVATRLARLAAAGQRVAPATFATGSRSYVCVYAERAGGVRMVALAAGKHGRREWHADVTSDGALCEWRENAAPVTRVADFDAALDLSLA